MLSSCLDDSYWDWVLDSDDLSKAPIWDTVDGFGGNGDINTPITVSEGYCVTGGPFANVTRAWKSRPTGKGHELAYRPHCMSRGFRNASTVSKYYDLDIQVLHSRISPKKVQKILEQPDFNSFFQEFEGSAHNAIPLFIMGDWFTLSAPNGKWRPSLLPLTFVLKT